MPTALTTRTWSTSAVSACICALIGIAVVVADAHRSIDGITWPYDLDQFRDIGAAQSMADGRGLNDPDYKDETIWYNPLLPATVAVLSGIVRHDVAATFVQMGPFLNALGPLAFFVMVLLFFGPWPALIALASLLFSPAHDDPPWASPSYSPWLFPSTFAPGLFYIGLSLCRLSITRASWPWLSALGVALGVTFLAHTAPALILGVCCAMSIRWASKNHGTLVGYRVHVRRACLIVFGVAVVVSVPFLWSLIIRYRLHVMNRAPSDWVWTELAGANLRTMAAGWLTYRSVLPLLGVLVALRQWRLNPGARLLGVWFATALILFGYGVVQQAVHFRMPPLVSSYHFYLYLWAAVHVVTGVGGWAAAEGLVSICSRILRTSRRRVHAWAAVVAVAGLTVTVSLNATSYSKRQGFRRDRQVARDQSSAHIASDINARLRTQTPTSAVVLASLEDSLFEVAPAGRRVVAVPREFSNPYVDFESRDEDQRQMWYAFTHGNILAFREVSARYGVTHVLVKERAPGDVVWALPAGATLLSWKGDFSLYAVGNDSDRR